MCILENYRTFGDIQSLKKIGFVPKFEILICILLYNATFKAHYSKTIRELEYLVLELLLENQFYVDDISREIT